MQMNPATVDELTRLQALTDAALAHLELVLPQSS